MKIIVMMSVDMLLHSDTLNLIPSQPVLALTPSAVWLA